MPVCQRYRSEFESTVRYNELMIANFTRGRGGVGGGGGGVVASYSNKYNAHSIVKAGGWEFIILTLATLAFQSDDRC